MAAVVPTQKFGYLDIKQSSKVRPRKLKSWKRRWTVLTKMSNLSSDEYVAKLDLYDNENKWRSNSSDKTTFVIENVTSIRSVKSKTHRHAFEVVEDHPVLVMSGVSELDSYIWILALQQIFTPDQVETRKDCYLVVVSDNEDSRKWNLSGSYNLTVSPSSISLCHLEGSSFISWSLTSLIKFNVKQSSVLGQMATLIIECGPIAPTGQSCFHFLSTEAQDILDAIKQAICMALAIKQNSKNIQSTRQRSLSATSSEKNFQKLLDSQPSPQPLVVNRSDFSSSHSTTFGSPTLKSTLSSYPSFSSPTAQFSSGEDNCADKMKIIHSADSSQVRDEMSDGATHDKAKMSCHKRSFSHPHKGLGDYTEIREDQLPVSRRNTLCGNLMDFDLDRLRSVSAVAASLEASGRKVSLHDNSDNMSDMDSAISSMVLSTFNDEDMTKEISQKPGPVSTDLSCSFTQRRSSSTPDLQTFWKISGKNSMSKCENVYEELDDLRASVQRLNKKQELGAPPELPARPSSFNFKYNTDHNISCNEMAGQSLPKQADQVQYSSVRRCTCDAEARSPFQSDLGKCSACKHKMAARPKETGKDKTGDRKSRKSPFSDINDVNAIILQVQNMKLRRASDITPVNSCCLLSPHPPGVNTLENDCLHPTEPCPERLFRSSAQGYLLNLQERADNLETVTPRRILNPVQSYVPNPLTHFFLDNDNLASSPVITEESTDHPHSRESFVNFHEVTPSIAVAHMTKTNQSFFPPPNVEASTSQSWPKSNSKTSQSFPGEPAPNDGTLTKTKRTWTWHEQNTDTCIETSIMFPVNFPDPSNFWRADMTSSNNSDQAACQVFFLDSFA